MSVCVGSCKHSFQGKVHTMHFIVLFLNKALFYLVLLLWAIIQHKLLHSVHRCVSQLSVTF